MQDLEDDSSSQPNIISLAFSRLAQRFQIFLDDITPYRKARWAAALILIILYMIRIILLQGWYLITYVLGIYHLSLFLAFLSPMIDPAMAELEGPSLPIRANEEFRPFLRRLPEFKFWYSVVKSTLITTFLTFFRCFDFYVFWPLLLFYFFIVVYCLLKRQIKHMIRYKYLPLTRGKPQYHGCDESSKTPLIPLVPVDDENVT